MTKENTKGIKMNIELGDEVKDEVSGFRGITVAKHTYLNGCNRWSVQPKIKKDGTLVDSCTFDEPNLLVIKKAVVDSGPRDRGGPEKYMPAKRVGE